RIHMEDDAGKLTHGEAGDDSSYVDLNRTGTGLIEIVSEPDMRTPEDASAYLKAIRDILLYLGICDGNMQEGSLRCDANISIRKKGVETLGTKAELKNMNSFKFIRDAIAYEIERQIGVVEGGDKVVQETRLFDVASGTTRTMRTKEDAHDYRYFPEPDLLPLIVSSELLKKAKGELPELPSAKKKRFEEEYNLPSYDAGVLTSSRELSLYFEEGVKLFKDPKSGKTISNWVMGELLRLLNENSVDISESPVTPQMLADLLNLIKDGTISGKIAKEVFEEMFTSKKEATLIVKEKGLTQISDQGELTTIIDKIISENTDSVQRYKAGKTKLIGFFVGEVMKQTKGQANPATVTKIFKEKLV
ncbi:MAG: Asp-tRNA(Asn)/Glu-tRNA(Gln) amidotransferase subunit GatB, partial [Deltaproteobacteria bacterium]|nr:Asp-tRNA(Asn)/Glu-tRNA(Gln) amidotransferase subunit GatB [Deltaproteobacteria bacterium]